MHICKHKLQKIAYCSDDKIAGAGDKIFAFVVKKNESLFQCYCFETQSVSHNKRIKYSCSLCHFRLIESLSQLDKLFNLPGRDSKRPKELRNHLSLK